VKEEVYIKNERKYKTFLVDCKLFAVSGQNWTVDRVFG